MQGKEASEQETKAKCSVGIDVSKSWLDVHVLPSGESRRAPNTREGVRSLKRFLLRFDLALVVVEATGKWHRPVQRSLHASAIPVAMVDPFRVRMFAKARGTLAKTDRLDAQVLAQFAAVMDPQCGRQCRSRSNVVPLVNRNEAAAKIRLISELIGELDDQAREELWSVCRERWRGAVDTLDAGGRRVGSATSPIS